MLLTEFFQFDNATNDFNNDRRYDADRDVSVVTPSDTRKIRLTLRQINQMRYQSEAHIAEKKAEASFIQQMYKNPQESSL